MCLIRTSLTTKQERAAMILRPWFWALAALLLIALPILVARMLDMP